VSSARLRVHAKASSAARGSPWDTISGDRYGWDRAPCRVELSDLAIGEPASRVEHDLAAVSSGVPMTNASEQAEHHIAHDAASF